MKRFADGFPDISKPTSTSTNSHRPPTDDQWDFYLASVFGDVPTLSRILSKEPEIEVEFFYDFPLMMAVRQGCTDAVRLLLAETDGMTDGAPPTTGNVSYSHCIETAEARGFDVIREMLVQQRNEYAKSDAAKIDVTLRGPLSSGDIEAAEQEIMTNPQLLQGSRYKQQEIFSWAYGADVDVELRVEMLRLLMDHGIDPNCGPFIHHAADENSLPLARCLLERGADPNTIIDSESNCMWIVRFRHPDEYHEMQALLKSYGGRMQLYCEFEKTPIESLLAADQETRDVLHTNGELLSAIIHNDDVALLDRYVELMGNDRVKAAAPNRGGNSPQSLSMLDRLIEHGLNINQRDWRGRTFLFSGFHGNSIHDTNEWVARCLHHGANLDVVEFIDCSTRLGYAAFYNNLEMASFLLENGADPNLPAEHEWARPLALAEKQGHTEMVELLKS